MAHGGQRQKPFMAYQETTSVSLVWSNPILFPEPLESDALVTHVDILPTMLDYLGIDVKPYNLQGKSYKALFSNPKGSIQDYVSGFYVTILLMSCCCCPVAAAAVDW